MKLRMYTKSLAFWQWDSREDFWHIRRVAGTQRLQCFDEALQQWVDVPVVVEEEGPGEKPE